MVGWMINWKGHGSCHGTTQASDWRDWRQPWQTSVRVAGISTSWYSSLQHYTIATCFVFECDEIKTQSPWKDEWPAEGMAVNMLNEDIKEHLEKETRQYQRNWKGHMEKMIPERLSQAFTWYILAVVWRSFEEKLWLFCATALTLKQPLAFLAGSSMARLSSQRINNAVSTRVIYVYSKTYI
jgi:hypothetical protein